MSNIKKPRRWSVRIVRPPVEEATIKFLLLMIGVLFHALLMEPSFAPDTVRVVSTLPMGFINLLLFLDFTALFRDPLQSKKDYWLCMTISYIKIVLFLMATAFSYKYFFL